MLTSDEQNELYNTKYSKIKPVKYTGEITDQIKIMLRHLHKLTKLAKIVDDSNISLRSHIKPYNDEQQDIQCYATNTYITVEFKIKSTEDDEWFHIIQHSNLGYVDNLEDVHSLDDVYNFKIIPGMENDETIIKINKALEAIVTTREIDLFNKIKMGDDERIFRQMKNFIVVPGEIDLTTVDSYSDFMHRQLKTLNDEVNCQLDDINSTVHQKLENIVPQTLEEIKQRRLKGLTEEVNQHVEQEILHQLKEMDKEVQRRVEDIVQSRIKNVKEEMEQKLENAIQLRLKRLDKEIQQYVDELDEVPQKADEYSSRKTGKVIF